MSIASFEPVLEYRQKSFHLEANARLRTVEQAIDFVNAQGIVAFWPIKGILLPSLWAAVAGDRPVPDEHDDPGHITWGWKDSMLGKKQWYYARIIHRRNTFVSLQHAPYFYALTANYGAPEEEYLDQYMQGQLTLEAKLVYEALLKEGPLDTISLRKAAHLTSNESNTRFNRALDDLMVDFKILPVGVCDAGSWHYAYVHDIVPRHFPDIPERARFIQEHDARAHLIEVYLRSVGAVRVKDLARVFSWNPDQITPAIKKLVEKSVLRDQIEFANQAGEWIALPGLI